MGEVKSYPPGTFCWVELSTPDIAAATTFYSGLFGWEQEDLPRSDGGTYLMCRLDGKPVTAIFEGETPGWNSHIAVQNLDAAVEQARRFEGAVTMEPVRIPGLGRSARIEDPAGASVWLWEPAGHVGAQVVNENGSWTWNELVTPLVVRARNFYSQLFGWAGDEITDAIPRTTFTLGELLVGGMHYPAPGEPETARWTITFRSNDVEGAAAQATELGGQVLLPPTEIPIGKMAILADPTGADFTVASFEAPWHGVDGS
jgi:predicted enzyme related to lactoylglutathione lyase